MEKSRSIMQTIEQALNKLETSKFRSSFALSEAEIKYIDKNGIDKIKLHAKDFVKARLSSAYPANDGKQTPMRGHPVFIAQHATACCCRKCLYKWYKVPIGVELTQAQQEKIVNLIMAWIERQILRRSLSANNNKF